MIEIINLNKHFGDKVIFKDFNITVEDGEFIVFAGKSGCGKTTLLNIIGGLENPDSGAVYVDGADIYKRKNQRNYFKNTVGFLFQNFALIENKTVKQNLDFIEKNDRTDLSIEETLKAVGLENELNTKVYKLSGGEQQRVALARLMLKKCSIILADEPTGSLDSENAKSVLGTLLDLNKAGKTIILVTHDERIIAKASKVVYL